MSLGACSLGRMALQGRSCLKVEPGTRVGLAVLSGGRYGAWAQHCFESPAICGYFPWTPCDHPDPQPLTEWPEPFWTERGGGVVLSRGCSLLTGATGWGAHSSRRRRLPRSSETHSRAFYMG